MMILVPIVGYPFSKTIWVAVDRAFLQHLDTNEELDERSGGTRQLDASIPLRRPALRARLRGIS